MARDVGPSINCNINEFCCEYSLTIQYLLTISEHMKRIILSLAIALAAPTVPAMAQGFGQSLDAGQANNARQKGDIIPLKQIFRELKKRYGGYQLDAELFSKPNGGSEYRIEWMTGDGERKVFIVDAQTGRIRG